MPWQLRGGIVRPHLRPALPWVPPWPVTLHHDLLPVKVHGGLYSLVMQRTSFLEPGISTTLPSFNTSTSYPKPVGLEKVLPSFNLLKKWKCLVTLGRVETGIKPSTSLDEVNILTLAHSLVCHLGLDSRMGWAFWCGRCLILAQYMRPSLRPALLLLHIIPPGSGWELP